MDNLNEKETVAFKVAQLATQGIKGYLFENLNPSQPVRVKHIRKSSVPKDCKIPIDKEYSAYTVYDLDLIKDAFKSDGDVMQEPSKYATTVADSIAPLYLLNLENYTKYDDLHSVIYFTAGGDSTVSANGTPKYVNTAHIYPDAIKFLDPKYIDQSFICDNKLYVNSICRPNCNSYDNVIQQLNLAIAKSDLPAIKKLKDFLDKNTDLDKKPSGSGSGSGNGDSGNGNGNGSDGKSVIQKIMDWIKDNEILSIGIGVSVFIVILVLILLMRKRK